MEPSKLYEALHALLGERVPLQIWGPVRHRHVADCRPGGQ